MAGLVETGNKTMCSPEGMRWDFILWDKIIWPEHL